MNKKSLIVILATVLSVCALLSGGAYVFFAKNKDSSLHKIIKIDKNSEGVAAAQQSFKNIFRTMERKFDYLFERMGGYKLVQACSEEPVLFGSLFIFFGVSTCIVVFVVHLIRTDTRFV